MYKHCVRLVFILGSIILIGSGSVSAEPSDNTSNVSDNTGMQGPAAPAADSAKQTIKELKNEIKKLKKENDSHNKSLARKFSISSIIVLVGLILFALLRFGTRKFELLITEKGAIRESAQTLRLKTITKLLNWSGSIFLVIAVVYMVLERFGVNVAPLLAGAGIVGLAFGFGGQYLIRDLINGIFILLEEQFRVNDIVKIGEFAGVVEDVNLRITTLRDAEGKVIIIPNGEIKTVVNLTKDFSQSVLNIGVAYKENVDSVMDVIKGLGRELKNDAYFGKLILADLEMLGVDDFADSQVTIRFRIKTLPSKQWEVSREMRRRIKNKFDELNIEIPFPHRTLYWGAVKDTTASIDTQRLSERT